jgi:hypothetical protein
MLHVNMYMHELQPHKSVFALIAIPVEEMISFSEEVRDMCTCAYMSATRLCIA